MDASTRSTQALAQGRDRWHEHGNSTALVKAVPYATWLGIQAKAYEADDIEFVMPYGDKLVGNFQLPALHGGAIAGFMEVSATLYLLLKLEKNRVPRCVDFSIDYLRSAAAVDTRAHCIVQRLGLRVASLRVDALQARPNSEHSRTVATARAHFLLEAAP